MGTLALIWHCGYGTLKVRKKQQPSASQLAKQVARSQLLTRALRHSSCGGDNNERLEFLGDRVLSLILSNELYHRYPTADEGPLSRVRMTLERRETLARLARELGVGSLLKVIVNPADGQPSDRLLAAALEAVIGALYLEHGLQRCTGQVLEWFAADLGQLPAQLPGDFAKDAKTSLKEFLQQQGMHAPVYTVCATGTSAMLYKMSCTIPDVDISTIASADNKRAAEQLAAADALIRLQQL